MSEVKILIAGGGIGGLTAAACLLKAGYDVEVFEQAATLGEIGAGLQLSANAVRVLYDLGLQEDLDAIAVRPEAYQFKLYHSAEVVQQITLGETYRARHGVPYYTLHRADFHAALVRKVRSLKTNAIRLGIPVSGFAQTESGVELSLGDGTTVAGRAIIGADGINSAIRAQLIGQTSANYTGQIAWRVTVPVEKLPNEIHDGLLTEIWVGPRRHAVVYYLRGGSLLNFVGCVEFSEWEEESWTARRPWAELKADFEGWHPRIQAIVDAADKDECFRWSLNNRVPVNNWTDGRVTLLGDAAHPTLPYMAQGACMAIEDGAILARALQQAPNDVQALQLYQNNRIERTTRIVNESTANGKLFHLDSVEALRDVFLNRDMAAERTAWLFSYDPLNVPLTV